MLNVFQNQLSDLSASSRIVVVIFPIAVLNQSRSPSSIRFVFSASSSSASRVSSAVAVAASIVTLDASTNTRSISTTTGSRPRFIHGTFNRSDPTHPASTVTGARSVDSAVFFRRTFRNSTSPFHADTRSFSPSMPSQYAPSALFRASARYCSNIVARAVARARRSETPGWINAGRRLQRSVGRSDSTGRARRDATRRGRAMERGGGDECDVISPCYLTGVPCRASTRRACRPRFAI